MHLRCLLLVCVVGACACASPLVNSSAFCSSPVGIYPDGLSYISAAGETNCSLTTNIQVPPSSALIYSMQYAMAQTSYSYATVANGIELTIGATAYAYPNAAARANISLTGTYGTAGPVRNGFLLGEYLTGVGNYAGTWSFSLKIGGRSYMPFGPGVGPQPFVLGQPFEVTYSIFASDASDDGTPSYADISNYISLRFVEADGATPVALSEVPEPGAFALLSTGSVLLAAAAARKRARALRVG